MWVEAGYNVKSSKGKMAASKISQGEDMEQGIKNKVKKRKKEKSHERGIMM